MGLISRWLRGSQPPPCPNSQVHVAHSGQQPLRPRRKVVTVAFRSLDADDPLGNFSPEYGYAYYWPFAVEPRVGAWAIADGIDGPTTVIVGKLGRSESARGLELKELLSLVPDAEVHRVRDARAAAVRQWLDYACAVATGLDVRPPHPVGLPAGLGVLHSAPGPASAEEADEYGRSWWRAYHLAADAGREVEDVALLQNVARAWFRERDRQIAQAQAHRIEHAVASVDIVRLGEAVAHRSESQISARTLAGLDLTDWLEYTRVLEREGKLDAAQVVAHALVMAAEQEVPVVFQDAPAPAFVERYAILCRKARDYDAEIAAVERWLANAHDPTTSTTGQKLQKRLVRAHELRSKAGG